MIIIYCLTWEFENPDGPNEKQCFHFKSKEEAEKRQSEILLEDFDSFVVMKADKLKKKERTKFEKMNNDDKVEYLNEYFQNNKSHRSIDCELKEMIFRDY